MTDLIDELAAVLGDGLIRDETQRAERARDTWMRSEILKGEGSFELPLAVAAPIDAGQLSEVVKLCRSHGVKMIPRGGGSGVVGGVLASADSLVISTERMTGLRTLDSHNLLATFGAGTNGYEAEMMVQDEGLTIGHWPQSIELSTVGGWVATRASGQYSTAYGNIEDVVHSLEAVLPDGSIYRSRATPRAAAGPDLRHLLLGGEGVTGLVTKVTFSLRPLPEQGVRQAFHFEDFDTGLSAIREVIRPGWLPPVVRLYDGRESWRHFKDQLPKGRCMLIFLHEGPPGFAPLQAAAAEDICVANGGLAAAEEVVDAWFDSRNTVPTWEELLAQGIMADTIEIATDWTHLPGLYTAVTDAISAVPGVIAATGHTSHSYRSGANLYFTFAAIPADRADFVTTYDTCWRVAMEAAAAMGAGLSHHHGIGRMRRDWMAEELGDGGLAMLRAVKAALDPDNLMNPGVLIGDDPA